MNELKDRSYISYAIECYMILKKKNKLANLKK